MRLGTLTLSLVAGLLALPAGIQSGDFGREWDRDWCAEDWGNGKARFCEVREVVLGAADVFNVDGRPNGGVSVRGVDRGEAKLLARVVASADTDAEARALAGEVRIETAGAIHAVGPNRSSGHDRSWWVSYRLEVPRRSDLKLEADNGGLSIENVVGTIDLSTVNGGLHLENVGGRVQGETVNGGIHVDLAGAEWEGEGLDLRTSNGGLHLEIPSGYNARLEAGTVNGGVHSDLPVTGGARRGRRIEADLGRGGRLLHLETTNGGVHIGQR